MKITSITPSLESNALRATIGFYREALGFELADVYPDAEHFTWASMHRDGQVLMFTERNQHGRQVPTAFTGSLYFRVDDVDALWQTVKTHLPPEPIDWDAVGNQGYPPHRIAWEPEVFDYGMKEFAITDPNGYLLRFGEDTQDP